MANQLTMAEIDTIVTLHTSGHTQREIAALLGVNRGTVGRYLAKAKVQNQPQAPTGNSLDDPSGCAAENNTGNVPAGTPPETQPQAPPARAASAMPSAIIAKIEQGLKAVRIHQDLLVEHGGNVPSYFSVRRFIARLREKTPLPFRRIETEAGEEAQVDFGTGALVRMSDGKLRRPWIFRSVLSYSRKGYREAVWRQTSEAFMQCLENAFSHFGGVPKRLVIDSRLVRLFNDRWEQVAVHAKAEPGRFRTAAEHIPKEKVSSVERDTSAMLRQVASIGPYTRQWSEAMTQARGVEGVHVLMGLMHLAGKHDSSALEEACRVALSHGA